MCEVVDGDDSEALERLVIGLEVRLDDWVQLIVVCGDVAGREVLDHDAEEHHRELFLCQFFRLSVLEHKLEKFRPLLLRDQKFAQLADHISDVLLDD